jgi:hypothetical protein
MDYIKWRLRKKPACGVALIIRHYDIPTGLGTLKTILIIVNNKNEACKTTQQFPGGNKKLFYFTTYMPCVM